MFIKSSEFIKSAVNGVDFPNNGLKEIAVVGRSNVGKSSFINFILSRKKIAKVSSTPGKTRTINFFLINNSFYLVDLPGYGYARVSKKEKDFWKSMVEGYFYNRSVLKRVVLLIDSRHAPFSSDLIMCDWIKSLGYNLSIIATKSDKLKSSQIIKNKRIFIENFNVSNILFYSILRDEGKEELLKFVFSEI